VVLSTLVVPLPEELTLLGAGYLAHQGAVSLPGAYLSALAAVLIGDTVTFLLGRGLLPKFLESKWGRKVVSPNLRGWAEELVREHQVRAILLARFLVGLRGDETNTAISEPLKRGNGYARQPGHLSWCAPTRARTSGPRGTPRSTPVRRSRS